MQCSQKRDVTSCDTPTGYYLDETDEDIGGGTVVAFVSMPCGPVLNCEAEGGLFLGLIRSSWDSVSLSKGFYYYVYIWHHVHGFLVKWSKSGLQRSEVPKND